MRSIASSSALAFARHGSVSACRMPIFTRNAMPIMSHTQQQQRSFATEVAEKPGIFGRLTQTLSGTKEAKEEEQQAEQQKQVIKLLCSETFTLNDFATHLQMSKDHADNNSGWRGYIPGFRAQSGLEELEQMLAMLNSLPLEKRESYGLITKKDVEEIASKNGTTVESFVGVFDQFKALKRIHQWVSLRNGPNTRFGKVDGHFKQPKNIEELYLRMQIDSRGRTNPPYSADVMKKWARNRTKVR